MIKIFKFLVFCLIPFQSYSFVNVDSLVQVADEVYGKEKAEVCLKLTYAFQRSDLQQSQFYAEQGEQVAKESNLQGLEAKFLLNLGIINTKQSNYSTAEEYYNRSIAVFRALDNVKGVGYCYNASGLNNEKQGNYKEAKHLYDQAQTVSELLNDTVAVMLIKSNKANIDYLQGNYDSALSAYSEMLEMTKGSEKQMSVARSYANIGRVFSKKGDYPKALENFYKALEIIESLGSKKEHANTLNNIGLIFSQFEMHQEAISCFEKAFVLFEFLDSKKGMGMIHSNLASRYLNQDRILKAEQHIAKALSIYDEIGVKSKGNLLLNLAKVQQEKQEYKLAEKTIYQAIEVAKNRDQEVILAACYAALGKLYLETKELEKAKQYLIQAESGYEKIGKLDGLQMVVESMVSYYKIVDEPQESINYLERSNLLRDSIYGLDQTQKITRLELERQRNQFLQKPNFEDEKEKSNLSGWWLLALLPIIGGGISLLLYRKKQNQKVLEEKLKVATTEKETIQKSLKQKNLEVTFLSLDLSRKEDFLKRVKQRLELVVKQNPANKEVAKLLHSVQIQDSTVEAWDQFKQAYEQVFPSFFDRLVQDYPSLSTKELRHCALIRLKIPIQEVSEISGVSINSIHKARHRLRTKFSLTRSDKLEMFIAKYGV